MKRLRTQKTRMAEASENLTDLLELLELGMAECKSGWKPASTATTPTATASSPQTSPSFREPKEPKKERVEERCYSTQLMLLQTAKSHPHLIKILLLLTGLGLDAGRKSAKTLLRELPGSTADFEALLTQLPAIAKSQLLLLASMILRMHDTAHSHPFAKLLGEGLAGMHISKRAFHILSRLHVVEDRRTVLSNIRKQNASDDAFWRGSAAQKPAPPQTFILDNMEHYILPLRRGTAKPYMEHAVVAERLAVNADYHHLAAADGLQIPVCTPFFPTHTELL